MATLRSIDTSLSCAPCWRFIQCFAGILVSGVHQRWDQFAAFLPAFAGIVFTNPLPRVAPRSGCAPRFALIAEISLGVFLAMSLMSMQLWYWPNSPARCWR
jgi:sodium--glutamate symport carrier gltS